MTGDRDEPGKEQRLLHEFKNQLGIVVGFCTLVAVGAWTPALVIYPIYYVLTNAVIASVILWRRTAKGPGPFGRPRWRA